MGYFSLARNASSSRVSRGAITILVLFAAVSVQATVAEAQSSRFGVRAGSRFVSADNGTSRRPYRRRQAPVVQQVHQAEPDFDYRLDDGSYDGLESLALVDTEDSELMPAGFCEESYDCCCDECGCGDYVEAPCCGGCCEPSCGVAGAGFGAGGWSNYPTWFAGVEFTFVKPRFSENVAFSTLDDDGAGLRTFTDTEFDYDLEMSPRAWIGAAFSDSWSWRCTYWQFDQSPATASTSPPANGNGEITHPNFNVDDPNFADVDLSTTVPTDVFTAASDLDAYTIDIEAVKNARINRWLLGVAGGVRYASTTQSYNASLSDGTAVTDQLDYSQEIEGIGPTISLSGLRPLYNRVNIVCAARGSLLFGDGVSRFTAVEDLLGAPATTVRVTSRDDLLPIGEARLGLEWMSQRTPRNIQWLLSTAMEGQIWGNAGNSYNESADLGFFGFSVGAGILR